MTGYNKFSARILSIKLGSVRKIMSMESMKNTACFLPRPLCGISRFLLVPALFAVLVCSGEVFAESNSQNLDLDIAAVLVEGDYETAFSLYRRLAKKGDSSAQYMLGLFYAFGLGVERNDSKSAIWFLRAAEQGDADAQGRICGFYLLGKGVPQSYDKATKWCRLGAKQRDPESQYNLGVMYQKGEGFTQDYSESAKWYELAAAQKHSLAQSKLGLMYLEGLGVKKNLPEAAHWFRLAADQGLGLAQKTLAAMYGAGLGVPLDYVEAYKWANLASAKGYEDAAKFRNSLSEMLTREQIAAAQKLTREWVPKEEYPFSGQGK